ncbi:MAG TPA: SPOR domain-containing protein [Rhodocyclaceae bacterium]|nr:SPOR domain-containing protein [Rhodocyclaceae bacterium]
MAKQQADTPPNDTDSEEDQLRRRLVNRIAIAGVLIVALLGGLAIVDAIYTPSPPPAPQAPKLAELPAEPAASAEEKKAEEPKEGQEATASAEKGEAKPEQAAESKEKAKTAEAVPERTESAPIAAPAKELAGAKPIKPLTQPAMPRQASIKPPETPKAAREEPAREVARQVASATPPANRPIHAPASKPLTQTAESARHYQVQLGVFANLANAEELRAKLELAGIPAHIEARVHVGPFSSKEEAEAAQVKLSAMGINPGILMATKR